MDVKIQGLNISYKVRRSENVSRPRIDFREGVFTVVLPSTITVSPEAVLERHESWVLKQHRNHREFLDKVPERSLRHGGSINLLGHEKEIVVEKRRSNEFCDKIFLAEHLVERNGVKEELEKLLREEIRITVEQKIEAYKGEINGEVNKVFIRDQRTRWGSCSAKNNLNFNWRLILGPEHVLEYVVVHELVHLEYRDHGEAFWNRVENVLPGYMKSKEWLEENRHQLIWKT